MEQLPTPESLWTCLKNHIVEALQKPGLRLPTLEEVMEETHVREGVPAASPLHQDAVDASSQDGDLPASSPKGRRVRGKSNEAFV